jgi:hypothetical protein
MHRWIWLTGLALVALVTGFVTPAQADKKPVKLTKEWKGSIPDEALQKKASEVITTAKALEELWKAWQITEKMPEVDFTKELVIVATSVGSKLNMSAVLDDTKGDLMVLGMGTRDIAPGFRYVIGTIPREGVKTVNGKQLP